MEESTSKEKVLKKVRNALIDRTNNPYVPESDQDIYQPIEDTLDVTFANAFTQVAGKFVYCEHEREFVEALSYISKENQWSEIFAYESQLIQAIDAAGIDVVSDENQFYGLKVGATTCEYLIARSGCVMVSSGLGNGRRLNVYPEIHIVVAKASQLVPDLKDALLNIQKKYNGELPSSINVITGPSRTADIEKTLVMGMHGPKELYVFLIDDSN
ncbi:MAG: LUD domain-containing protein [Bacteroidales bacterium]|nr:LUD domain-containing protein [Bacteroidales bacterium]